MPFDLRLHHHRHPDFRPIKHLGTVKAARGHAEHRIGESVDTNGPAGDIRITCKPALPGREADDCIRACAWLQIVFWMEETADYRLNTEHVEIVSGSQISPDTIGTVVRIQAHLRDAIGCECGEDGVAVAEVPVVRKRL